jgi:hypothetical protein
MRDKGPPNQRRFWQLHLSTAILLMFVAGGLVWLLLPDWQEAVDAWSDKPLEQFANPAKMPNPVNLPPSAYVRWGSDGRERIEVMNGWRERWYWFKTEHFWKIFIAENFAAALGIAGAGILVEYLLRRREGRKP